MPPQEFLLGKDPLNLAPTLLLSLPINFPIKANMRSPMLLKQVGNKHHNSKASSSRPSSRASSNRASSKVNNSSRVNSNSPSRASRAKITSLMVDRHLT